MSKIISVSRRTDIPAFYSEWFSNRISEGFVGYENPFGGQKYVLSLKKEDVLTYVFWSKNYRPFLGTIDKLNSSGYNAIFNYTITGLPKIFECNLAHYDDTIDSLKEISRMFSPEHINWRYDPIVISTITPVDFHVQKFTELCEKLTSYVYRCYFSFAIMYGKVERNFKEFQIRNKISISDPSKEFRIELANKLAKIAAKYGIKMFTCCGDYLINNEITKAHCIDGNIVSNLFFKGQTQCAEKPTRKECGCSESTDIGKYNTCPHGCIYCYANVNKMSASNNFKTHDNDSVFLGYSREQSEQFIANFKFPVKNKIDNIQMKLDL